MLDYDCPSYKLGHMCEGTVIFHAETGYHRNSCLLQITSLNPPPPHTHACSFCKNEIASLKKFFKNFNGRPTINYITSGVNYCCFLHHVFFSILSTE